MPVIQSLHNFRILCANGLFYRDGKVCEECFEKSLFQGVIHKCYKDSRLITACVAKMISRHWKNKTWKNLIDYYITASNFTKNKYIEAGIPESRILVKPNFVYPETKSINESVDKKLNKTVSSGSSTTLIESKTYENPQFLRMKDLMSKLG